MGLFDSPQKKWVNRMKSKNWNQMFSDFSEVDAILTKCMFYHCCNFADDLLNSGLFKGQNMALRIHALTFAKMYFYHMVTKSQTTHNLLYGYLHELYTNFYKEDLETANLAVSSMRSNEKWYIERYYEFGDNPNGNWIEVKNYFFSCIKNVKCEGEELYIGVDPSLELKTKELLTQMLFLFAADTK